MFVMKKIINHGYIIENYWFVGLKSGGFSGAKIPLKLH